MYYRQVQVMDQVAQTGVISSDPVKLLREEEFTQCISCSHGSVCHVVPPDKDLCGAVFQEKTRGTRDDIDKNDIPVSILVGD